ncbi:MAG: hypothetical protein ABJB86_09130 [Bacteroidota bacterium]
MKKLQFLATVAVTVIVLSSCGNNNAGSSSGTADSSANVTKPPDNNDATNPSLADTAYSKNNADTLKNDSSKMKK